MSKWNEKLVINFLKAYRQHPCLWNPYHKDYYNCYAKNEALQKVIEHLDSPGLAVTDYLQQIKIIREKYKEEQTRMIKSLQTQKQYKSPFPWYDLVTDMLAKVIVDEEKIKQRDGYTTVRSLSSDNIKNSEKIEKIRTEAKSLKIRPCNNAICDRISRRSKSVEKGSRFSGKFISAEKTITKEKNDKKVRYVPCPQYRKKRDRSRDREENANLSSKPTRDTEFHTSDNPTAVPSASANCRCNGPSLLTRRNVKARESAFLKCPLCGWEDSKYEETDKSVDSNFISCSAYSKNLNGVKYTPCPGCDNVTRDDLSSRLEYTKKYIDNSGDFEIIQDLSKELATKQTETVPDKSSVESRKLKKIFTNAGVQYVEEPEDTTNKVAVPISLQTEVRHGESVIANKLKCGAIEASTQLKINLANLDKNVKCKADETEGVCQNTQCIQCAKTDSFAKGTQFCFEDICPEMNKIDRGVNTVTIVKSHVQNMVDAAGETKKCVHIQTLHQTDEKYIEKDEDSGGCSAESKAVMVNMVDHASKGIQSIIYVSRGNMACFLPLGKMVEAGTAMSAHRIRSIGCMTAENIKEFKSKCVQCIPSKESLHINKEQRRCPGEFIRDTDLERFKAKETLDLDRPCTRDTCPLNILNLIKENPSMAAVLHQLLGNILYKRERNTQRQTDYDCSIEGTEVVKAVKEYMTKTLGLNIAEDNDRSLSQFVEAKPNFADSDTSTTTCDNKLCMTEESMFRPLFQSATMKREKRRRSIEDDSPLMENACKRLSIVDKEACACSNYKSIGSNGPLKQFPGHDVETQSCAQLLKDSVCVTKYDKEVSKMVSVGTQKRDQIVVRLIKCAESQAIVRSDKETLTVGSDADRGKNYTDRRIEACGRSTCVPPEFSGKLDEFAIQSTLRKECVGKAVSNHCKRSVTFKDDICDISCRGKLSYDWTDVRNSDILSDVSNSKIPLCVKPRKCTLVRNN